ncbi:hypothetical protein BVRB_7g179590 [Beta vulgaris subsp. vulgaris]|uniref:RING-type E3 ubiquitin transferase n=1 Tax=Beta vulgaris subsp. vulgaris TaxID=3555 RepID=A0A0J8BAQ5_BETVV|nr:hypothetical protein BVRB_7g179590 [Beta vulgaris subsp. vulgaris]
MDPYAAIRMMMLNNNTGQGVSPRLPLPQIQYYSQQLIPRYIVQETDGSKLITREEQEIVLKKLKKKFYNPIPKILARRVSLYYRDLNRDSNSKAMEKHRDEERKSCAVCLEDFEPREEVMLTPCTHMFHEECTAPWVKEHGKCPVCRANPSLLFSLLSSLESPNQFKLYYVLCPTNTICPGLYWFNSLNTQFNTQYHRCIYYSAQLMAIINDFC